MSTSHDLQEQVAEEIRVVLARRRLTATKLARRLGWAPSGMSRRLVGQTDITVRDLGQIAAALEISPSELLGSATKTVPSFIVSPQVRHGSLAGLAA